MSKYMERKKWSDKMNEQREFQENENKYRTDFRFIFDSSSSHRSGLLIYYYSKITDCAVSCGFSFFFFFFSNTHLRH